MTNDWTDQALAAARNAHGVQDVRGEWIGEMFAVHVLVKNPCLPKPVIKHAREAVLANLNVEHARYLKVDGFF